MSRVLPGAQPDIPQAEMGAGSVATSCPRLLCSLCGFPKEKHRPEAEAHHSECTLEQFTTVEKIPYVKVTRPDSGSVYGCWMPLAAFSAEDEFGMPRKHWAESASSWSCRIGRRRAWRTRRDARIRGMVMSRVNGGDGMGHTSIGGGYFPSSPLSPLIEAGTRVQLTWAYARIPSATCGAWATVLRTMGAGRRPCAPGRRQRVRCKSQGFYGPRLPSA